jgi:hypothetical protein
MGRRDCLVIGESNHRAGKKVIALIIISRRKSHLRTRSIKKLNDWTRCIIKISSTNDWTRCLKISSITTNDWAGCSKISSTTTNDRTRSSKISSIDDRTRSLNAS